MGQLTCPHCGKKAVFQVHLKIDVVFTSAGDDNVLADCWDDVVDARDQAIPWLPENIEKDNLAEAICLECRKKSYALLSLYSLDEENFEDFEYLGGYNITALYGTIEERNKARLKINILNKMK